MVAGSNPSIENIGAEVKHTPNIDRSRVRIPAGVVAESSGMKLKQLIKPCLIDKTSAWWCNGRAFVYQTEGSGFESRLGWSRS